MVKLIKKVNSDKTVFDACLKEPFSPHGRGLVTTVYVVKRSFQFDMRQDTGRHMSRESAKVHLQSLAY